MGSEPFSEMPLVSRRRKASGLVTMAVKDQMAQRLGGVWHRHFFPSVSAELKISVKKYITFLALVFFIIYCLHHHGAQET